MSVGKTVVRKVDITATEEGIAISLVIDVDAAGVYTAFAEARSKTMIYMCDPSNRKFRCRLIKDWGVWENYQVLPFYHENNAIRTVLSIALPNTVVNRLIPLVSGHVMGIKVVTDLDIYMLYNNKAWEKVHARLKKRVFVTEKAVKKTGVSGHANNH
jgi:hypothetical protein